MNSNTITKLQTRRIRWMHGLSTSQAAMIALLDFGEVRHD